jgi:uncharacterized caspase-like protein
MSTRQALCVGINNFQNLPDAKLNGCINDAHDMAAYLKSLGFAEADITVLIDEQATKAAIMQRLTQMVNDAKAGKAKRIVFSLSSHGTQVPDTNGDEKDKADEAFCPTDLTQKGRVWHPDHIITDDELNALFAQLPANVLLEVYLDTCHSGTGIKQLWPVRYLPPPAPIEEVWEEMQGAKSLEERAIRPTVRAQRVLWAGCRADQTSADASFDNRPSGAFTYYYLRTLRDLGGKATRSQIITRVRAQLRDAGFEQIPQLETNATLRERALTED